MKSTTTLRISNVLKGRHIEVIWWVGGDLDIFKLMSSLLVMVLMQGFLTEHFRPIGPNHKELWSYLFRL